MDNGLESSDMDMKLCRAKGRWAHVYTCVLWACVSRCLRLSIDGLTGVDLERYPRVDENLRYSQYLSEYSKR